MNDSAPAPEQLTQSCARYTRRFALLATALLGVLSGFNWLVDPYYVFASPSRASINELRTEFFNSQLLSKPYAIERYQPNALMLGSSRTGTALRPSHPGLAQYKTYNGALAGSTLAANLLQYRHAKAVRPLDLVLINPDFYMFNAYQRPPNARAYADFEKRVLTKRDGSANWRRWPMRFSDYFDSLLAWSTLKSSVRTIAKQRRVDSGEAPYLTIHEDGHWTNKVAEQRRHQSYFKQVERLYIPTGWVPADSHRFAFYHDSPTATAPIDEFRWFLEDAYSNDTKVIITLMPYHARLLEAMRGIGIWQQSEDWKRRLVTLTEEVAGQFQQEPFPVWDFTGYTRINMEPLPERTALGNHMQWYRDSSHVQQHTGDMILDRVLAHDSGRDIADDFGVRLTSGNLEAHLANINRSRSKFLTLRPNDAEEIRNMVARAGAEGVVR